MYNIIQFQHNNIRYYTSRTRTQIWCYIAYSKRRVMNDSALGNDKVLYPPPPYRYIVHCHSITLYLSFSPNLHIDTTNSISLITPITKIRHKTTLFVSPMLDIIYYLVFIHVGLICSINFTR